MPLSNEQKLKFKQFLKEKAYGKPAFDGGTFNERYTEVTTFSELEFVEVGGRLEANITETYGYQLYYAKGTGNYRITQDELEKLAETVGIQFDPKSNFHGKVIISDSHSIKILRQAGVIKEKALSEIKASAKSTTAIMSASLKQLVTDHEALQQLEEAKAQLEIAIKKKQQQIYEKTEQFHAKPIGIHFDDKFPEYELCLMPSDEMKLEKGKLYLREKEGCIAYTVITPEEKEVSDVVIKTLKARNLDNLTNVNEEILKFAFNAGHTQSFISPQLKESYYTLRKLLKDKFYEKAWGEWNPLSPDIISVKLRYSYSVSGETKEASEFLRETTGCSFKIDHDTWGSYIHHLTQEQCECAIEALRLISDKSQDAIREINSRPIMKC